MRMMIFALLFLLVAGGAAGELRAGVARASITPLEQNIPTQLGGYGAREGKPAEGIHDTLWAKALVFEYDGQKSALITLDVCSVPRCVVGESLAKAGIEGLTPDTVVMAGSHTHAGIEGYSMDRRNVADNPHIGVFSEAVLSFVTDRVAQALRDADTALRPVTAGSGIVSLPGMNRNRRGDPFVDEDLTLLRLDAFDGKPYVILVNYTAHGTIMSEREMLVSGGWSGVMQRTVEAVIGEGASCMYTNGAEGDMSPRGAEGGSRWEKAEDYGRRVGLAAARLAETVKTKGVRTFAMRSAWVDLPPRQAPPDFVKIAGEEYGVTQEDLDALLPVMFPDKAPIYALRVNGFELVTFPGEPICQFGLTLKDEMRRSGVRFPCVAGLAGDNIGYILTKDEYHQSGYEVTVSFYGDGLGEVMLGAASALAQTVAKAD